MRILSRWLWAQRGAPKPLIALLLALSLPAAFAPLVARFEAATGGLQPFDNQFALTPASMIAQLAAWTPEAIEVYHWFALLDFVFPPMFSLAIALSWAWLIAKLPGGSGQSLADRGLLALPLTSAVFDWIENIGNLLVIARGPVPSPAIGLALLGKYGKLSALALALLGTLALVGYVLVRRAGAGPQVPSKR